MRQFILTDECYKCRGNVRALRPKELRELIGAKNDSIAFQVLCDNGGERCLLNPGASPALSYELGLTRYRVEVLCDFPAAIYAEGYLKDERGILTADILFESPQIYDGGLYAPAYIKLDIPSSARTGKYSVTVNVYRAVGANDESLAASHSLPLTVYDFSMPSPKDFRCHLDLWQHNSNIARTYGVELWSDEHFAQIETVLSSLAELGQKSATVLAGDCPWRGWGCYLLKEYPATLFEYSMVRIRRDAEGKYFYDFSVLKRYIQLCEKYAIDGDITVYGLMGIWKNMPLFNGASIEDYPENLLIRYKDEADGCYKYMRTGAEIEEYIRALFAFFRENALFEKVRIGADEPADLSAYRENYERLRRIAPDLRFKMALDKTSAIERFSSEIDDIAASFPCSCRNRTLLREKKTAGKRVLWYICNIPDKPNSVLHSELTELRSLGALGYLFGFDGFLRWAYTCWTERPLEEIRYNNTSLPAGDVNFVYPAKNGKILYSLRYFALKKALQDYELLLLLSENGRADDAEKAVRFVLKNTNPESYMKDDFHTNEGIYSEDYEDYVRFRAFIFQLLERSK